MEADDIFNLNYNHLMQKKIVYRIQTYIYELRKSSLKEKLYIFTKSLTDLQITFTFNGNYK